jgi:hypothetical protein
MAVVAVLVTILARLIQVVRVAVAVLTVWLEQQETRLAHHLHRETMVVHLLPLR